jgi:AraC-like DNA-binding protein
VTNAVSDHRPGLFPGHNRFRVLGVDELARTVSEVLKAKLLKHGNPRSFVAHADYVKLRQTELWFCSYDIPVSLLFSEGDFFRVQFHQGGLGATEVGSATLPITANHGCITTRNAAIHFEHGFEQIVWRIPREVMNKKLVALTGQPISTELIFNPSLDLKYRNYDTLSHLLACVIGKIQTATGKPNPLVLAEVEQAMLVALLCQTDHNWRKALDGDLTVAVPWQVHRVEEYITAHWNERLDISTIAGLTGTSVRSLFRSFKQFRGYTPGEFSREQRLRHAREMLLDHDSGHSIASVVAACGFSDAGHFSREFKRVFGEPPSAMRKHK